MNDDQRQDERMVGRAHAGVAANGDNPRGEDEGNPFYAILRFSKALAPWYRTIFSLCVVLSSLVSAYGKIVKKIDDHDALILKAVEQKYEIKFHDYDQNVQKSGELEGRI